ERIQVQTYTLNGELWSFFEAVKLGVNLVEGEFLLQLIVFLAGLVQVTRLFLQLKTNKTIISQFILGRYLLLHLLHLLLEVALFGRQFTGRRLTLLTLLCHVMLRQPETTALTLLKALQGLPPLPVADRLTVQDLHGAEMEHNVQAAVGQLAQRVSGHVQLDQVWQRLQLAHLAQ
ncbi:hypothetical protein EGW08_000548, partial [Elysia chlorotica]